MPRFRLRTLLIAFALISIIFCALFLISRIGGPLAVVVVSSDPTIDLRPENVVKWSKSAMLEAGLTPTEPAIWGGGGGDEGFIGRNANMPNDRVFIQWFTGTGKPTYRVMIERSQVQITAYVARNY